jgi:hypothetical protein
VLAVAGLLVVSGSALARPAPVSPTPGWQALTNPPPFEPGATFLMTDGTVMVQDLGGATASPDWWRLAPDSAGSYVDGTWSQLASLPNTYAPTYYASAVLPDGRLAIAGGEYNNGDRVQTNLGAIYDPVANTWTMIPPPNGGMGNWTEIGDGPSEVLADGRWLIGGVATTDNAILDPSTLTWTTTGAPGKKLGGSEAGFSLLPNGKVLTVDVAAPACETGSTEILDPATMAWSSAGFTPTPLANCGDVSEIGPQLLTYDGKVFAEGARSQTALYNVATGTWSAGPVLPTVGGEQQGAFDAGSALLPNGDVLFTSRAVEFPPTVASHVFLYDGTSLTMLPDDPTTTGGGIFTMLLLPTGQVLTEVTGGLRIYTGTGSPDSAWMPTVTSVPTTLAAGQTYTLNGKQLNGLSDGTAFGDDFQGSTNYPLVQITNDGSGVVTYARTSKMANRSIAPGALSCTDFTLPAGIPAGTSKLRIVANGIASAPVAVTIGDTGANTTSCVPQLSTPPAISGVAAVGRVLTSSPGTWDDATTFAYQWQRCGANGSGCTDVLGATQSSYAPTSSDVGSTIRSTVGASNGNSAAGRVASNPTRVVAPAPRAISPPVVSGSPRVGQTLATTPGKWGAHATFAYRWLRCDNTGSACAPVKGATVPHYRLKPADAGHKLEAEVSATTAAGGRATQVSHPTRLVK